MRHVYTIMTVTAFLLSANFVLSQSWTKMNLPETGKHITSMMEGPDGILYASTAQGLFSSSDNANTWELVNRGMKTIALDVTSDGKPVCLNTTQLLSIDDSNQLELFEDLGFFIVQFTPEMLTANDGSLHLLYGESLQMKYFISTDNGVTFTQQTYDEPPFFEGFKKAPIFKNPNSGDLFYFADNNTLQRSTDNGTTYSTVGSELNISSFLDTPFSLDPISGAIYHLANVNNDVIVMKSIDNGQTWTAVSPGNTFGDGIAAYNGQLVIWGGNDLFYSADDGANWENVSDIFGTNNIPDGIFISSNGTFYGYNNSDNSKISEAILEIDFQSGTATRKTTGLEYTFAQGLASNGSRISASLSKWAHYSDDNGETWTPLKGEGANSNQTYVANDGTVYTEKWANGIYNGIYVQNEQDSMIELFNSEGEPFTQMKFMFEDDSDNIYLLDFDELYKSSNGGDFVAVPGVPIDILNHQKMWFSSSLQRIFSIKGDGTSDYSDDEGATWTASQPIGGIAQTTFPGANEVWGFNLSTSFAEQGYYRSIGLQTWTQESSTTNNLSEGAYGLDENTIIAATDIDIQLSEDAGLTWEIMIDGLESAQMYDWQGLTESINIEELEQTPNMMLLSANGGIYFWEYSAPTSIVELELDKNLMVYPNPIKSGSDLNIGMAQIPEQILIYNFSGELVKGVSNNAVISTAGLSAGIYLVKVVSENYQGISKLVIN